MNYVHDISDEGYLTSIWWFQGDTRSKVNIQEHVTWQYVGRIAKMEEAKLQQKLFFQAKKNIFKKADSIWLGKKMAKELFYHLDSNWKPEQNVQNRNLS